MSQAPAGTPRDTAPKGSSTMTLSFGPTESNPEGKAAANKLLQAFGGPAKVNAIKTMRQTIVALDQGERVEIDQTVVYPDKQAQRMRMQGKTVLLVVTHDDAFMVAGTRYQNLSPNQRQGLDAALRHDPINVLQHINDPKYIFNATGHEQVGGVDATVVEVDANGIATRWWIAPDGKLLRERFTNITEGDAIQIMNYSGWKEFGGLHYPTKYEMFSEAGQPLLTMTLTGMEVNQAVSPKLFERP